MSRRIDRRTVLGVMLVVLLSAGALMAADPGAPGEITFVGKNAFATANGTFHVWRVVDRSIDLDDPGASWAEVEIDLSVSIPHERRTTTSATRIFEIEAWPWPGSAPIRWFRGRRREGRPRFAVRFDLDLHGVEKTLDEAVLGGGIR